MSNFVSLLSNKTKPLEITRVQEVGERLAKLSEEFENGSISFQDGNTKPFIDKNYTGNGKQDIDEIFKALAVRLIKQEGGKWVKDRDIGPDESDELRNEIKVTIVFEDENEMILAVPHKHNLDFGLQNPPMAEAGYQNDLYVDTSHTIRDETVAALEGLLTPAHLTLVHDTMTNVIDDVLKPSDADEIAIFHQQLGAYSCRQCG